MRHDIRFAIDLGLVRRSSGHTLEIACPLYRELLLDALMWRC